MPKRSEQRSALFLTAYPEPAFHDRPRAKGNATPHLFSRTFPPNTIAHIAD